MEWEPPRHVENDGSDRSKERHAGSGEADRSHMAVWDQVGPKHGNALALSYGTETLSGSVLLYMDFRLTIICCQLPT